MFKKTLGILIFSAVAIFAQSSSVSCNWRYETGKRNWDDFENVIYTKSNTIIATGVSDYTLINNKLCGKLLISGLNQNGSMIWTKSYGDSGSDCFGSKIIESGANFYVLGRKRTALELYNKAWLLKLDSKGDTIWTKTFDPKYKASVGSLSSTGDFGAFITVNVDTSRDGGYSQLWVLRLNDNGDTLWSKLYNYKDMISSHLGITTEDGGLLVAGVEAQWSNDSSGIFVIKLDPKGDTVWTRIFPSDFNMYVCDIKTVGSNGYLIAGGTDSTGSLIIRIDKNGKTLWLKHFGFKVNNTALSVQALQNGNFVVCGQILADTVSQDYDIFKIRLNQDGDSLNCSIYESPDKMVFWSGTFIDENNFIVCGSNYISTYDCNAIVYNLKDTPLSILRKHEFSSLQYSSLYHIFNLSGRLISKQTIPKLNMANGLYIGNFDKKRSAVIPRFDSKSRQR